MNMTYLPLILEASDGPDPVFPLRTLQLREVKCFAQSHTPGRGRVDTRTLGLEF